MPIDHLMVIHFLINYGLPGSKLNT
jgi:hypothetical protein